MDLCVLKGLTDSIGDGGGIESRFDLIGQIVNVNVNVVVGQNTLES